MAEAGSVAVVVTGCTLPEVDTGDDSTRAIKSPRTRAAKLERRDSPSPRSSAHMRREGPLTLPTIDANIAKASTAAKRISNVFTKTLAGKAATTKSNDALALGAYASMFGKFKRRTSPSHSHGTAASAIPPPVQLPTYRLEPLGKQTVRWARLQIMVDSILTDFIRRGKYSKSLASSSAKSISQNIRIIAKELGFSPRYKMVAIVDIGESFGQGFMSSSRCLWNTELDGRVTSYKTSSVAFIAAALYFIYTD